MSLWPNGARCAVVITVDMDGDLGVLASEPRVRGRDKTLSVWRYGITRGAERLLTALDDAGLRASWFVPGLQAETRDGLVAAIATAGHEVACHGHAHEDFNTLDRAGQRDAVARGCDALAAVTGHRPTGFRTPSGSWAPELEEDLAALGIRWTSAWNGDDLPYFHLRRDGVSVVELPVHYELEDYGHFVFNLDPAFPKGQGRIAPYREVLGNWSQEFDAYHRFGLCYVLRLNTDILGTPGRIGLLTDLVAHMRGRDGVWFATGAEVADWWSATAPDNPPDHPIEVFRGCLRVPDDRR